jgi:pilus assembly protein CpaF
MSVWVWAAIAVVGGFVVIKMLGGEDKPASGEVSASEASDTDASQQSLSKLDTRVYWKLLDAVQAAMAARINPAAVDNLHGQAKVDALRPLAEQCVDKISDEQGLDLSQHARKAVITGVLDEVAGLGPLEKLMRVQRIRLIQVRGAREVKVTVTDQPMPTDCQFRDDEHVLSVIRRVLEAQGKVLTPAEPAQNVKLADGSNFIASMPPASPSPFITIKKPV